MCGQRSRATEMQRRNKEQAYKPLYGNLLHGYKENDPSRNVAIKQYAAQVELQGGRKRIENRLAIQVSEAVLHTKKPAIFYSPSASWTPTTQHQNQPTNNPHQPFFFPSFDVPPPPPGVSSGSVLIRQVYNSSVAPARGPVVFPPPRQICVVPLSVTSSVGSSMMFPPPPVDFNFMTRPAPAPSGLTPAPPGSIPAPPGSTPALTSSIPIPLGPPPAMPPPTSGSMSVLFGSPPMPVPPPVNSENPPPTIGATTPIPQGLREKATADKKGKRSASRSDSQRRSRSRSSKRRRSRSRSFSRNRRYNRTRSRSRSRSPSVARKRRRRSRSKSRRKRSRSPVVVKSSSKPASAAAAGAKATTPVELKQHDRKVSKTSEVSGHKKRSSSRSKADTEKSSSDKKTLPKANKTTSPPALVATKPAASIRDEYKPETLSNEEVKVLQQLAKSDPQALERFMLQNPKVLMALLNRDEQFLEEKSNIPVQSTTATPVRPNLSERRDRDLPTFDTKPLFATPASLSSKKPAPSALFENNVEKLAAESLRFTTTPSSRGGIDLDDKKLGYFGLDSFGVGLNAYQDCTPKISAPIGRSTLFNTAASLQSTAKSSLHDPQSAESILLQMLADEEEKKRTQAESEQMLLDLFDELAKEADQLNKRSSSSSSSNNPAMAYDRGRRSGIVAGLASQLAARIGDNSRRSSGATTEIDTLVNEANFNVQQAKLSVGDVAKKPLTATALGNQSTAGSSFTTTKLLNELFSNPDAFSHRLTPNFNSLGLGNFQSKFGLNQQQQQLESRSRLESQADFSEFYFSPVYDPSMFESKAESSSRAQMTTSSTTQQQQQQQPNKKNTPGYPFNYKM